MRNIILASCILAASSFTSCSDFLDVVPTNSIDANQSVKTAADAQVIVRGLMSKMASGSYYGRNFPLYGDTKGGDITITSQGRGYDYLYVFNHAKNTNNYSSIWSQGYHCIAQVNNLLSEIEKLKTDGSTENFDNAIGQALTARAMIYFDLVRLYGEPYNENKSALGVPITLSRLEIEDQLGRNTVEENYLQILTDLKDAEPLLPKTKTDGFLNYYANKALQARAYLYMDDFPKSLAAAEEIITSNRYKLYENNQWVSSWASEFGTEAIFELGIYPKEGDLGNTSLGAYYRRRGHPTTTIAAGYFTASTDFIGLLNQDPNDVRKGIMSNDEISSTRFGACYKYSGSTTLAGDKKTPSNNTAVNIKVIRLSEVYLIASEAALRSSTPDLTKASSYLNEIRKRSPNLTPSTSASVTLDMIEKERSKELFTEGHRFFDMMRWNKSITFDDDLGSIPHTHRDQTIDRTFYKTILPIPLGEMDANKVIQSQQNPGYNN